ncbi:MAG: hypothetical protein NWF00_08965 [Candidatus Bathyarchaeota archaeon]|nr:hypothetical protein [Candidatus Bathyarchaeota archaeon]
MKARVAVATVNGKAYFFIVNELWKRKIPFLSLIPSESIPAQIKLVVTTPEEKQQITHPKILTYDSASDPDIMGSEVVKLLQGKAVYENVTVGVDPGEVTGLAVVADSVTINAENCFSAEETLNSIKNIFRTVDASKSAVTVKIGNGVPVFRNLVKALDESLPSEVALEIVNEAGTNKHTRGLKNGRGLRHIVSALRIAERQGHIYSRRKTTTELDSWERQDAAS